MAYLDNPAGRLQHVLEGIRQQQPSAQQRVLVRDALAEILGVDGKSQTEFLRRAAPIFDLPEQIRGEVKKLGYTDETHVEHLAKLADQLPNIITHTPIDQFFKRVPPEALQELRSCSGELHRVRPQQDPDQEKQLPELRTKITAFITDVLDTQLPEELHRYLIDRLREMESAIDQYQIEGLDALRSAVERSYGGLVLRPDIRKQARATSVVKKFRDLLQDAAAVATIATAALVIPNALPPEMPPLEQPDEVIAPGGEPDDIVDAELVVPELEGPSRDGSG